MLTYISNSGHYAEVLSRVPSVKHTLWIGTADIKDLYVDVGKQKKPFLLTTKEHKKVYAMGERTMKPIFSFSV